MMAAAVIETRRRRKKKTIALMLDVLKYIRCSGLISEKNESSSFTSIESRIYRKWKTAIRNNKLRISP